MITAGFARQCINPSFETPMEGLLQKEKSKFIHDDLFVRSLSLRQDGVEALIISFDLLFFERSTVDRYKGALGRVFGLRPSQIFLNTTHTHAGPRMTRWKYEGCPDCLYLDQIEEALIMATGSAIDRRRPVTLWACSTSTRLPVSRRKLDASGKAQWLPNLSGTTYNELPVCVLKDETNSVVSLLFSVACHPSMIYESAISAEYPGVAMRELNSHFQTEGSIFLQGAAGDTKPRHVAEGEERWKAGTWDEMEAAGTEIASAVIKQAETKMYPVRPHLQDYLTEVKWPLEPPPTLAQLLEIRDHPQKDASYSIWAGEMLTRLERRGHLESFVPIGLHFLQLGIGLRLIGIEGEVLAKLGLRIRELYNQGITFVLGYTNGTQIYMPVTEELCEGGYEVNSFWEYHLPSQPAEGCETELLNTIQMIRDNKHIGNDAIQS